MEEYIVADPRSHMIQKASMYVGSINKKERSVLTHNGKHFSYKQTFLPFGLERSILEVEQNSFDAIRKARARGFEDPNPVCIEMSLKTFSIKNGGKIPEIKQHSSGKTTIEVIFSEPYSSDNFNAEINSTKYLEKKTNGDSVLGRNGVGAKLATYLSKWIDITAVCKQKMIELRYIDNGGTLERKKESKSDSSCDYILLTFEPDFRRFDNYGRFTDVDIEVFRAHAVFSSYCNNKKVTFSYLGKTEVYEPLNIYEITEMLIQPSSSDEEDEETIKKVDAIVCYDWGKKEFTPTKFQSKPYEIGKNGALPELEVAYVLTPGRGRQVSCVNGSLTSNGGSHVESAYRALQSFLLQELKLTAKKLNITLVKKHISIICNANIAGEPDMDSNTKTQLMSPDFNLVFSKVCIAAFKSTGIVSFFNDNVENKIILSQAPKVKSYGSVNVEKLVDAHFASLPHNKRDGKPLTLYLVEGDSANNTALKYTEDDRDHLGCFPLKGKPIGASNKSLQELLSNKEVQNLLIILGISGNPVENKAKTRYDRISIFTDSDRDGDHIKLLLLALIPAVLTPFVSSYSKQHSSKIYITLTPNSQLRVGNKRITFKDSDEYEAYIENNPKHKNLELEYLKGLSSYDKKELKEDKLNGNIQEIPVFYDEKAENRLNFFFGKEFNAEKREWLYSPSPKLETDHVKVSTLVDTKGKLYSKYSIDRGLAELDGFKEGSRKIISAALERWKWGRSNAINGLESFCGYVKDTKVYHPGADTLYEICGNMTRNYAGTNNIAPFTAKSMFGDRDGEKDGSPRYMKLFLNPLLAYIIREEFAPLMTKNVCDGLEAEFKQIYQVIPLILCNGTLGLASVFSSKILPCNPKDVVNAMIALLSDKKPLTLVPWFNEFKGTVQVVSKTKLSAQDVQTIEEEDDGPKYAVITGIYSIVKENEAYVKVTELPISMTKKKYREFLDTLCTKEKEAQRIVERRDYGVDEKIDFRIYGLNNPSVYTLGLRETVSMNNMHILFPESRVRKYTTHNDILVAFYEWMTPVYEKLYNYLYKEAEIKYIQSNDKYNLIRLMFTKEIDIIGLKAADVKKVLTKHNINYDTLESLSMTSITEERIAKLLHDFKIAELSFDRIKAMNPKMIWLKHLEELKTALSA